MHIAFYSSKNHLSGFCRAGCRFLRLDGRLQDSNCLFHRAGSLHHLRQKHLSGPEQFADLIHTAHQRTVNNIHGTRIRLQRLLQVFFQMVADTFYQGIFKTFLQRLFTPGFMFFFRSALFLNDQVLGIGDQLLCRFGTAVQDHIFQQIAEFRFYIFIQYGRRRVDNTHIQSLADSMVKEYGVHRLTYIIISTE